MASLTPIETPDDLMRVIARAFDSIGVAYFVTGSQASMMYGEPRFTNDVDVVSRLRDDNVDAFCEAVETFGKPEVEVDRPAAAEAVRTGQLFKVSCVRKGIWADIIPPHLGAYEATRFARVVREAQADGTVLAFAAPEDVILTKLLFYKEGGSEKHIRDITSVIRIQRENLDFDYLNAWAYLLDVRVEWTLILKKVRKQAGPEGLPSE